MQEDELVLSDVHLQVRSDKGEENCISRFYFSEEVSPRGKRQKSIFRIDNEDLKEKRTEDKGGKIDSNDKSDCSSGSDIIPDNADDIDKCGESSGSEITAEKGDVFVKCGESSGSRISAEKASLIDKSSESSGSEITPEKAGLIDKSGESSGTEITPEKAAVIDNSGDSIRSNNTLKRVNLIHTDGNFDIAVKIRNDQDGDIVVKRRKRKVDCSVITIAHKLETSLEDVGLQIWLASLYMADFVVSSRNDFKGKRILDLGAGVGLTSIVAALYADHVICTDIGKDIINLAQHNLNLNNTKEDINFTVMELDWFNNKFFPEEENQDCTSQNLTDIDMVESSDVIISADVIYDDDITDALFRTAYGLLSNTCINTWYISLEKRFVFTVTDLDVACPAYQHFRECLNQIEDLSDEVQFKVSLVDDVPQCFQYKRTKELELWKVTVQRKREKSS